MTDLLIFCLEITAFSVVLLIGGVLSDYVIPWVLDRLR
ncbi:MAG: hypothetical protein RIR91_348 [Verrucomicrobiota bacterium]|jgi:hypothetical protein